MDVRGEDRGLYLPTGRGWQDRVISDAFCNNQPPVAASSWDDTLYQPAERKSSQRGYRDFYRNTPSLTVWVWGMMHLKHLYDGSWKCMVKMTCSLICCCLSLLQPRSLIANLLGGPSTLASIHFGRDGSLTSHTAAGIIDGASAPRSLSPLTNSGQLRGSLSVAHRPAGHNLAMSKTMVGSG